jgi:transposase-like protein
MLEQKVVDAYADGSPIQLIAESFKISHEQIKDILIKYKEESRFKKTFTDEFKKMISQRDINGVSRRQIADELNINANTVKKACEQFGQALKERAVSENTYTRINGNFTMKSCPSCGSSRVNAVEENTIYCKSCGEEHIINEDHALKLNWEYLDE